MTTYTVTTQTEMSWGTQDITYTFNTDEKPRSAYQLTGDVLRYVAKVTGVSASKLMNHAIVTTDAAKVVEQYFLPGGITRMNIHFWDLDGLIETIETIDWS